MFEEFLSHPDDLVYKQENYASHQMGRTVISSTALPYNLEGIQVALIGVREDRGSVQNVGSAAAPDEIRKQLFSLSKLHRETTLADLGNVESGKTLKDTHVALSQVVNELLRMKIVPVIIGGSHDLTFAQYGAYHDQGRHISVTVVDSNLDLMEGGEEINDENFLVRIFTADPSFLFSFNAVAYQTHLVAPQSIEILEKLQFEGHRLGKVRMDMQDLEPVMRSSNLCSFDLGAVRFADNPANYAASPNGLFGEEFCQLARYAGQSESVDSFGLYGCNLAYDHRDQGVKLAAQAIWYFLDGVSARKHDFPAEGSDDYLKFTVQFKENRYEMNFWKSRISDRWWMEVPVASKPVNHRKSHMIPCSYHDYLLACREEVPERWLKAFQKLS